MKKFVLLLGLLLVTSMIGFVSAQSDYVVEQDIGGWILDTELGVRSGITEPIDDFFYAVGTENQMIDGGFARYVNENTVSGRNSMEVIIGEYSKDIAETQFPNELIDLYDEEISLEEEDIEVVDASLASGPEDAKLVVITFKEINAKLYTWSYMNKMILIASTPGNDTGIDNSVVIEYMNKYPSDYKATPPTETEVKCEDSDRGRDFNKKGEVEWYVPEYDEVWEEEDTCRKSPDGEDVYSGDYLIEMTCEGQIGNNPLGTALHAVEHKCQNGCRDGACIDEEKEKACRDTDDHLDYFEFGETVLSDGSGLDDSCRADYVDGVLTNTGELLEAVCTESGTEYVTYECPGDCKRGACISGKEMPFIIKGRLIDKFTKKPLSNIWIEHADNSREWRTIENAYTNADGKFKFVDNTFRSGYVLYFHINCYASGGIVGEYNEDTGSYEFYLYTPSEYCNEKRIPVENGVVDLGDVELLPAANLELTSDVPLKANVYQKSKYCNDGNDIGGAGSGSHEDNGNYVSYVGDSWLFNYSNQIIVTVDDEEISSEYRNLPIQESGCYNLEVEYMDGEFSFGDLVRQPESQPVFNEDEASEDDYEAFVGYRFAKWICYDGSAEDLGFETVCKYADEWKRESIDFCEDKCNEDESKCGVNSFGLFEECVLTERPEGHEEIIMPGEVEFEVCKDSCPLDGNCYDFGYRKSGEYCSDSGEFIKQLEDAAVCDNNFECSTNLCIDGGCVSSGIWQAILNFFERLFG